MKHTYMQLKPCQKKRSDGFCIALMRRYVPVETRN